MKRVLSGNSLPDTAHFKNLLEQSGIPCLVKNRELGGGLGDLPVFDCAPELWVLDDARASQAEALIRDSLRATARGTPWRCSSCGEDNEPQFGACWACGSADPRAGESV
ncbi:MAG TPA: DUF2007 domain-containing protein [Gammaproteobacteria bacterium]|nr:DUF2007 domain-containing protein [Gammaproteobacteria bacterium]